MDAPHPRDMQTPPPQKKSKAASRVPQPNFTRTPNSAPPRRHLARRVKGPVVSMERPVDRAARLKVRREEREEATDYSDQSVRTLTLHFSSPALTSLAGGWQFHLQHAARRQATAAEAHRTAGEPAEPLKRQQKLDRCD